MPLNINLFALVSFNLFATPCIVTAQTVKVKTRVLSKPGTRSTRQPRYQLTPQIWCVQQRLIASRLRLETLHLLRRERGAFIYRHWNLLGHFH